MSRPAEIADEITEAEWDDIIARDLSFKEIEATYGEEVAIYAGIARDPDTEELDDEWFKRARPVIEVHSEFVKRSIHKYIDSNEPSNEKVLVRLDADLALHFLSVGPDWQTRLNDTLRRAVFGP